MAQGYTDSAASEPDGHWSRKVVGAAVKATFSSLSSLTNYFHYETHDGVADTNEVTILNGETPNAVAIVIDKTNNLSALCEIQGGGNAVAILAQSGTHFGTTAGNAGTVNVHFDTDHYAVENETAASADFEVLSIRVP